jgi:hypothetical protein
MASENRVVVEVPSPLKGAMAKLQRAQTHLDALDGYVRAYADSYPCAARVEAGPDGWQRVVVKVEGEPDASWSITYGEAAAAVRSALDYVVNELAILNGHPRRESKFPVFEVAADFDSQAGRFLVGLHPQHVEAIRNIQPFNEDKPADHPLRQMAWISNRDKHRDLQPAWVIPRASINDLDLSIDATDVQITSHRGPVSDGTAVFAIKTTPAAPVLIRGRMTLDVGFGDLLLTRDHLKVAIQYTLWLLNRFQNAWADVRWSVPDEFATRRLPSGVRDWSGELVIVAVDGDGQERTHHVPGIPMRAGERTRLDFERVDATGDAGST